ncbi:MAG: hypothetical protein RIG62_15535 [Cyclobacteriaceae bacterium]
MLSDQHVEIIRLEIERSTLSMQTLKDDLLDHYCCFVEQELEKGHSFETAFSLATEHICPNGFREIQEETMYLLNNSKIMAMKKIMYFIGLVTSIGISVGWLFRILHWPGGNELFTYGFLGFVLLFLPMLAINQYKATVDKVMSEKLKIILGFSSAIIIGAAVLFKMMHLQGANILLVVGALLFSFGFLPFLFFRMYKGTTTE